MSRHTPGPWHVHVARKWHHVKAANGDYVMEGNYRGVVRQHKDARLIAAAPMLLEALKRLTELAIGPAGGVTQSDKREAIDMAISAIAAATGETA